MATITIEYNKDGDKTIARLLSDGKPGIWHVAKQGLLDELEHKMLTKTITRYSFCELVKDILANNDFDYMAEDEDQESDFINAMLKELKLNRALEILENPYSPIITLRVAPKQFWTNPKQKEWFFSGPNLHSSNFSNAKRAHEVLAEISMKKQVTDEEKVALWGLLSTNVEIPKETGKGMVN